MASSSHKSLASREQKVMGNGCLRLFFVPFFLMGAAFFYMLTIRPLMQVAAARSWQETPCVVDSSQVASHSGGDGSTYSIEVIYHYRFAGQDYTAKRYNFTTGSSSGRNSKAAVVERFPPGTEAHCYVNPAAPHEAVIDRGPQLEMAFGAFGLIFLLIGGLGILFAPRLNQAKRNARVGVPAVAPSTGVPGELKPQHTPLAKFFGVFVFALIWNGLVSVFVYFLFFSEEAHKAPLFAKIFISIFVLIGLGAMFAAFTSFLALFNPRIRITAQSTAVPLGGEFHFTWVVTGRTSALRKLRILFEGREEATYKRGTSTSTDTQVFAEIPVFETADRELLLRGSARVAVPKNLMHTFEGGRNKVLWRLKIQGEIPRWPDVADDYPIVVLPLPPRS